MLDPSKDRPSTMIPQVYAGVRGQHRIPPELGEGHLHRLEPALHEGSPPCASVPSPRPPSQL